MFSRARKIHIWPEIHYVVHNVFTAMILLVRQDKRLVNANTRLSLKNQINASKQSFIKIDWHMIIQGSAMYLAATLPAAFFHHFLFYHLPDECLFHIINLKKISISMALSLYIL